MPWDVLTLNDGLPAPTPKSCASVLTMFLLGHTVPGIAVQTAFMHPGEPAVNQLLQAFDIGFSHIGW
jgi:hypothetical protein